MDPTKLLKTDGHNQNSWSISYADHIISDAKVHKSAEAFKNCIWIEKPAEAPIRFPDLAGEQFNLVSFDKLIFPTDSGVKAIRIYVGLDVVTNRIHHFFEPVVIMNPVDAGRGLFNLSLSSVSQSPIGPFTGVLYKIEATDLVRIDTESLEMQRFANLRKDYLDCIRFQSILPEENPLRSFDFNNDTLSGLLLYDVIADVLGQNSTSTGFIYSTLSLVSNHYRHSFCFTHSELSPRLRVYSYAEMGLQRFSANYAQLCPTRCGNLSASLVDLGTQVFELV